MRKAIVLTAPAHWACYLLNNDLSGIDESELDAIDDWLERQGVTDSNCVSCQPCGFVRMHDAFNESPYGADCEEYTFLLA